MHSCAPHVFLVQPQPTFPSLPSSWLVDVRGRTRASGWLCSAAQSVNAILRGRNHDFPCTKYRTLGDSCTASAITAVSQHITYLLKDLTYFYYLHLHIVVCMYMIETDHITILLCMSFYHIPLPPPSYLHATNVLHATSRHACVNRLYLCILRSTYTTYPHASVDSAWLLFPAFASSTWSFGLP